MTQVFDGYEAEPEVQRGYLNMIGELAAFEMTAHLPGITPLGSRFWPLAGLCHTPSLIASYPAHWVQSVGLYVSAKSRLCKHRYQRLVNSL